MTPGRADLDEHVAGADGGNRHVGDPHDVADLAVLVDDCCLHG
ncbi:hypothetical protein SSAG_00222 [Streptomyces sp. Mg1]|nr:hypothetical protein SSAG_00222 [Streptomyces sp. Mg1]